MGQRWNSLKVAGLALDVPDQLASSNEFGIEGGAAVLEGAGLRLTVDASPFADPLTRYAAKPGYEHWREAVGSNIADFVLFEEAGTRTIAANIPGRVTAVVHQPADAPRDVALQILRSIRTDNGESND
ncbi:MAG: hypothetical protein ACLGIS_09950 [Actinomycetes bacterium]